VVQPTLASTLRMAADLANNLDKFLDGITGLHGSIDAEIEENIRAAVRELHAAVAVAQTLARPRGDCRG